MVKRLKCLTYKERPRQSSLRLEGQKWRSNCCLNYLLGSYGEDGGSLFLEVKETTETNCKKEILIRKKIP